MVKVKVITSPEMRESSSGIYGSAYVVDELSKSVKNLNIPVCFVKDLKVNKFYMLTHVSIGAGINIKENSKIMECSPFFFSNAVEQEFLVPKCVSVEEALASPTKAHISVTGLVHSCTNEMETAKSKRRLLFLKGNNDILTIKLWGEKTKLDIPPGNTKISVTNLQMAEYMGKKDANSTKLTTVMVEGEEEDITDEIEAACYDGDCSCIIISRREFITTENIFLKAFPEKSFVGGVVVHVKVKGGRIVSLEMKEKKNKRNKLE